MAKLASALTGNFDRITQKNIRQAPNEIDEIFDHVYKSFEEQITKTIRIPRSKKIQLINNQEIIASTLRKIYHINFNSAEAKNRKKQVKYSAHFDIDIISMALTSDKQHILVLLANNTIQVLRCPSLLKIDNVIHLEIEINNLASHEDNFIIGDSSDLIVKWKWENMTLHEHARDSITGYKCVHRLNYFVKYSERCCSVLGYDKREYFCPKYFPLPIKLASISHRQRYFALFMSDGQTGSIEMFELETGELYGRYTLEESQIDGLEYLKFGKEEEDILCGYKDGAVLVFNLKLKTELFKRYVSQKITEIYYVKIGLGENNIYMSGKTHIYIIPIPSHHYNNFEFEDEIFNLKPLTGNRLFFLKRGHGYTLTELDIFTQQEINTRLDLESMNLTIPLEEHDIVFPHPEIICAEYFDPYIKYILAIKIHTYIKICALNYNSTEKITIPATDSFSMVCSSNKKYLLVYDGLKLLVIDPSCLRILEMQNIKNLNCFYCLEMDFSFHIAYDHKFKSIKFLKLFSEEPPNSKKSRNKIEKPDKAPVSCFASSTDNKYLFTGDIEGKVRMWNLKEKVFMALLGRHSVPVTYLKDLGRNLYSYGGEDSTMLSFEIHTGIQTLYSKMRKSLPTFLVSSNNKWFVHSHPKFIEVNENLYKSESVNMVGVAEPLRCMKYIKKLWPGEVALPYEKDFETALIFPYNLKTIDFYAHFNNTEYLEQSLKNGFKEITNCQFKENALSFAAMQNFKECSNILIEHIVKNLDLTHNPYKLRVISNETLVYLNKLEIKNLSSLYDMFVRKSKNTKLPKIIDPNRKLPMTILSDEVIADKSKFQIQDENLRKGKEVHFLETVVKLDYTFGSKFSSDFLTSLINTPNKDIFRTQFVNLVLNFKWNKLMPYMISQAVLYFFYLISLLCYLVWFDDWEFFLIPFTTSKVLLIFEILQLYHEHNIYFRHIKNWIDIFRPLLVFMYGALLYYDMGDNKIFLNVILFLSFFRGIYYFRLFKPTRYLINLLIRVLRDARPFLVIFSYTTIATGYMLFSIDREGGAFNAMGDSYILNLGEFSTENYDWLEWIIFLIGTLVNPIIMLNLLISIIAETFQNVKEERVIADNLERAEMILEFESLFTFNWKSKKNQYLQVCTSISKSKNDGTKNELNKGYERREKQSEERKIEGDEGKQELREVKQELRDVKDELRELKEALMTFMNAASPYA